MISAVIPTVDGRESYLARAIASLRETAPIQEFLIYKNRPTCGVAWNEGIEEASGFYVLLFADDLEAHLGWLHPALLCLGSGSLPCPRILNPDGTLQSCGPDAIEHENGFPSDVARVPFLPLSLAQDLYPVFENQYAGDYWITREAGKQGWPTVVVREMLFTHHLVAERRLNTLQEDWNAFLRS